MNGDIERIPPFDVNGNLPPGVHVAGMDELIKRFGGSKSLRRSQLTKSLREFYAFARHYAIEIYVDGSYVTAKLSPSDVDIIVLVPADFARNPAAFFRLLEFTSDYARNRLHIFVFYAGTQANKLAALHAWFVRDRDANEKGIVRLET